MLEHGAQIGELGAVRVAQLLLRFLALGSFQRPRLLDRRARSFEVRPPSIAFFARAVAFLVRTFQLDA